MIFVAPSKTVPIREFPLCWRWTQGSHALFTADELASMRAVDPDAGRWLGRLLRGAGLKRPQGPSGPPSQRILEASDSSGDAVRAWLRELPVAPTERVWLSYEPWGALEVPWALFVSRYSDFCYPSSDDVVIVPSDLAWVLEYWHDDVFAWLPQTGRK